ncbi:MAG: glycosyltransferase family 4 protein [Balneolaceae bacterium]|nr:MAG: glycosyltransferase family 4 protein [Balneolaceae bacterium]
MLGLLIVGLRNRELLDLAYIIFLSTLFSMSLLGWMDDRKDLSRKIRFGTQIMLAAMIIYFVTGFSEFALPFTGTVHLGLFGVLIGIIWLTGVTNIYNFMDGIDGLSSVQAIGAGFGWSLYFYLSGEPVLFSMSFMVIGGVAAFLFFNWPPAKIFMGDVGSLFLGFLFGALPFYATYYSSNVTLTEAIWVGALLLWPFLFDGAFTIVRRYSNGENIFEGHRSHLYQRLHIQGWSHKKITLLYSVFILISVVSAILFTVGSDLIQLITLSFLISGSFGFAWTVSRLEDSNTA